MIEGPHKPRPRRSLFDLLHALVRPLALMSALVLTGLVAGFFVFVTTIPRVEPDTAITGDGIVVLTGAADRLADAFKLLANGRAKRLLISGVNPATTKAELVRVLPQFENLISCCADLGYRALNTAGNAVETREWTRRNGFESVIVVTSGWHMRRSLLEVQRSIPEVILIPYPVIAASTAEETWWLEPGNLRLLVSEYVKYLAALVEVRIAPRVIDEAPPANPDT